MVSYGDISVTFMRLSFIPHPENSLTFLVGTLKLLGDLSYEGEQRKGDR